MSNYSDLFIFALVLTLWIVLNRWVLPWFGVSTCMSGSCSLERRPAVQEKDAATTGWQQDLERGTSKVDQLDGESHVSQDGNRR